MNDADHVTRRFNASSAGLSLLVGLDLRWAPLYAISRSQMKRRIEKTVFRSGFEAVSCLDHSSNQRALALWRRRLSVIQVCLGFQNCGRLLPLVLLLAFWQFAAVALVQSAIISGSGSFQTSSAV